MLRSLLHENIKQNDPRIRFDCTTAGNSCLVQVKRIRNFIWEVQKIELPETGGEDPVQKRLNLDIQDDYRKFAVLTDASTLVLRCQDTPNN